MILQIDGEHDAVQGAPRGEQPRRNLAVAAGLGLARQSDDGAHVVRVAAAVLVEDRGRATRLPVAEQVEHVRAAVVVALDEGGRVADRLLLLIDRGDVGAHDLRRDLHVADRVVRE